MMCKPCVGPVRIDGDTTGKPKKLCNGQLSFATVHGQRCKVTKKKHIAKLENLDYKVVQLELISL